MDGSNTPTPAGIDFEHIFDISPDLIFILDTNHNIIRANKAMENCLGVSLGALAGSKCFWNMHQSDAPPACCVHEQMLKDGQEHPMEVFIEPLDGWFSVTVTPLLDKEGNITGSIHIAHDITERKKTEEKLRESELCLQQIIDNIGEALLFTDPNGNIISANPAACRLFERSEAEICQLGRNGMMDINDPRLPIALNVRSKTGIFNGELNCIKKDRTIFPAELTSTIFEDSLGNPRTIIILRDISERQRTERTLRESEEKFKAVFESAIDGIFQMTSDGKFVAVNDAFARMHGFTVDEMMTMDLKDLETPETRQLTPARIQRVLAEELLTFEVEHFCKNGRTIPLEVSTNRVSIGTQNYILGFHRDITARKQAEETIIKSQLLLQSSLESQKDTILFSIDQDYRYLYFNKAHSEVMNYAYGSEIKIGTNILEYISVDDDRKVAKENYDRALQGESHSNIRIYGDLHLDYYESFFNPIVNDNNEIIGATGLARNITNRKTIEEALKLSEVRYEKAQEIGHIGGWEYDITKNTFWGSDEGKRIYGFEPDTDFFLAEDVMKCVIERDRVNQAMVDLIEKNQPYNIVFDIIPINSTQKRTINSIAELVRDENGNPIKVTGVMQDITTRRQAEEELKLKNEQLNQANADKDKFFSIIAHDLRSPFQPLLGFTRMLVEDLPTLRLDEIQKIALNMRNSASKLFNLLENLLEWSRMQRGITTFEPESFLILPKLSEGLVLTLDTITRKEIDLIYEVPGDLAVFADGNMFESTIRNLVSNAIKFTAPKGKITILAKSIDEHWVEMAIKDTGIGMNREMLDNLFKLDAHTNRKGINGEPSTGLGLIICKDFIEKHSGKLWVESEVNRGSTFYFTLPSKAQN